MELLTVDLERQAAAWRHTQGVSFLYDVHCPRCGDVASKLTGLWAVNKAIKHQEVCTGDVLILYGKPGESRQDLILLTAEGVFK